MIDKKSIQRLDPIVSSQIAAGEVVERPASVVKELAENALDAGAKRIVIEVADSGLSLMRVSDDGQGMTQEEAVLSVERFATSKIRSLDDLRMATSLGFRGEALPSIASCSKMTLLSRTEGTEVGAKISVEAGAVMEVSPLGLPQGTTVEIRQLFYNTPARLEFIKSRSREKQAIIDVVEHLALSWPDIRFELTVDGKKAIMTSGTGLRNVIADLYGPDTANALAPIESSAPKILEIAGFVCLPKVSRRQRDRQFVSVNGRPVRIGWMGWALDQSYRGLLAPRSYPVVFLNLSMPPEQIDVNVHPTKAEVRFKNESEIRRVLMQAISHALVSEGFGDVTPVPVGHKQSGAGIPQSKEFFQRQRHVIRDTFGGLAPTVPAHELFHISAGESNLPEGWGYLGHIQDTYLVAKTPESLLLIDKHALMESITYAKLLSLDMGSQELLMADIMRLSPKESACYEEHQAVLEELGFQSRLVGENTVMVTAVPLVLGKPVLAQNLKDILTSFEKDTQPSKSPKEDLVHAKIALAACHASVRAQEPMSPEEAAVLLTDLAQMPQARTCPHGRPTVREIPLDDIHKFFGRAAPRQWPRV